MGSEVADKKLNDERENINKEKIRERNYRGHDNDLEEKVKKKKKNKAKQEVEMNPMLDLATFSPGLFFHGKGLNVRSETGNE